MAAKKEESKIILERAYNIPLRKEYQKVPRWKRTPKAVRATQQFLAKHMKTELEKVRLGKELNEKLWLRGMTKPPHHVKVTATKDEKGMVKAELFGGKKKEAEKEEIKKKKEEVKAAAGLEEKKD